MIPYSSGGYKVRVQLFRKLCQADVTAIVDSYVAVWRTTGDLMDLGYVKRRTQRAGVVAVRISLVCFLNDFAQCGILLFPERLASLCVDSNFAIALIHD